MKALFTILAISTMCVTMTAEASSRYRTLAHCEAGATEVYVVERYGSTIMYVYEYGRLQHAAYADEDLRYSSDVVTTVYSTGSLGRGGYNLRIRSEARAFEGSAHLTSLRGGARNLLMECDRY